MKYIPPSVEETAFNCPHCGALARQFWLTVHAASMKKDELPFLIDEKRLEDLSLSHIEKKEDREEYKEWARRKAKGRPFFNRVPEYSGMEVNNVWISHCYNCGEAALWLCDRMIYPQFGVAPVANSDMPDEIRQDYNEASAILDQSPRGAAALIRLAIQKLCKELGQPGKNINDDIGALVRDGLDPGSSRHLMPCALSVIALCIPVKSICAMTGRPLRPYLNS